VDSASLTGRRLDARQEMDKVGGGLAGYRRDWRSGWMVEWGMVMMIRKGPGEWHK
jgi:hypothetical protein